MIYFLRGKVALKDKDTTILSLEVMDITPLLMTLK